MFQSSKTKEKRRCPPHACHDSMRQGMLSLVWLLLEQLAVLCAATGKLKYMRLITELRGLIATMPLADLLFYLDMSFTDMGSRKCADGRIYRDHSFVV